MENNKNLQSLEEEDDEEDDMPITPEEQAEMDFFDSIDLDTITPERIAEATLQGDDFVPQNPAEEYLKKEIKENDGIVDIPNEF